jgi:amino acid transporter
MSLGALFPGLETHRVLIGLVLITFLTAINMRGVKESGLFFSVPTYVFLGVMTVLIGGGIIRFGVLHLPPAQVVNAGVHAANAVQSLGWVLLMRAFVAGCAALTRVEAIANGVPVFHPPQAQSASKTLMWMVGLLGALFLGVGALQHWSGALPQEGTTLIGSLARAVYGDAGERGNPFHGRRLDGRGAHTPADCGHEKNSLAL